MQLMLKFDEEAPDKGFPGGSKNRVNKAGDAVRNGSPSEQDLATIEAWRVAHRDVLNTFQALLRTRTRRKQISVAQRHKRKLTIFDKLRREPRMKLSRMDDVAGCRLIFESIRELYLFRLNFLGANFDHSRRNNLEKWDYIRHPKATGYRGVHDVYEYNVRSERGRRLTGLNVEIQYRTLVQHAWATAVEVIGFITRSQPKYQEGDKRLGDTMALASEILARAHEQCYGPFPSIDNKVLVEKFSEAEAEIGLLKRLRGLKIAQQTVTKHKNVILIFDGAGGLEIKAYKNASDAFRKLFELERDLPDKDIVFVRANSNEEIQLAFRNYFSDSKDFIDLVESGCKLLLESDKQVLQTDRELAAYMGSMVEFILPNRSP